MRRVAGLGGAVAAVAFGVTSVTTLTAPPAAAVAPVTVVFHNGAGVPMTGCLESLGSAVKQCVYGVPPRGTREVSAPIHDAPGVGPGSPATVYLTGVTGVAQSDADAFENAVPEGGRIACQYDGGAIGSSLDCYPV